MVNTISENETSTPIEMRVILLQWFGVRGSLQLIAGAAERDATEGWNRLLRHKDGCLILEFATCGGLGLKNFPAELLADCE